MISARVNNNNDGGFKVPLCCCKRRAGSRAEEATCGLVIQLLEEEEEEETSDPGSVHVIAPGPNDLQHMEINSSSSILLLLSLQTPSEAV